MTLTFPYRRYRMHPLLPHLRQQAAAARAFQRMYRAWRWRKWNRCAVFISKIVRGWLERGGHILEEKQREVEERKLMQEEDVRADQKKLGGSHAPHHVCLILDTGQKLVFVYCREETAVRHLEEYLTTQVRSTSATYDRNSCTTQNLRHRWSADRLEGAG